MQIPVSEAFQENERTEVSIELDPDQVRWLKDQAAQNDVSPDQIVRYLINSQIRDREGLPTGFHDAIDEDESESQDESSTSVLDELRDASNMLDDLTSDEQTSGESGTGATDAPSTSINTPSASDSSAPSSSSDSSASDSSPSPSPSSSSEPESSRSKSAEPGPSADPSASRPEPPSKPKTTPKDFVPDELQSDDASDANDEEDDTPSSMFEMVDDE